MTSLAFVALAFAGGAIVLVILNNWRNGLYFFLDLAAIRRFARKYLGNNMAIYSPRIFWLPLFISPFSWLTGEKKSHLSGSVPRAASSFFWFGAMQVFNPASTHLMYGVMGLKLFFLLRSVALCGYACSIRGRITPLLFVQYDTCVDHCFLGIAQAIIGHTFLSPQIVAEDIAN